MTNKDEAARFDTSLAIFFSTLLRTLGKDLALGGWVLRDSTGRLAYIAPSALADSDRARVADAVAASVPQYRHEGECVLDIEQPGVRSLVDSANPFSETIQLGEADNGESVTIRLIDHRIVGQDWLSRPAPGWVPPQSARIVFASLKGGVGRSTALVVVATELARLGRKVLAIDLDLEAPGIGTMLLGENEKPKFGVLDWYVERGVGSIDVEDRTFLLDMIAPSRFGQGKGLIDVAPAVGRTSDAYPANVLAKIARAYLELPQEEGRAMTFLAQTQVLINQLTQLNSYDAVLIDARAGLNESTSAALLGLGADVLLFGVDTSQTFASYRYLLAHLARFERDVSDDWLLRLRMVHAKASRDKQRQLAFRDRAFDLFSELLYRRDTPVEVDESSNIEFGLDDPTAPHHAWTVLWDGNYAEFDAPGNAMQLAPEYYRETFDGLLTGVTELLRVSEDDR